MANEDNGKPDDGKYTITVTMTSDRDGRSKPYQTTVFTQNFSDHNAQVVAVQKIFPAVAMAIGAVMVQMGDDGMAAGFKPPK
jgi:hypothetical protein